MQFEINKLTELGITQGEADRLTADVLDIISTSLCLGDSVAIPGFGRFSSEKENEYIGKDLTTGKTYLFPPHIGVKFTPSGMLKKGAAQ